MTNRLDESSPKRLGRGRELDRDAIAAAVADLYDFGMGSDGTGVRGLVEREAEALVAFQLDLLAQLECQLRAVHRTMRQIEKLRSAEARREGVAVSNGEKLDALNHLTHEPRPRRRLLVMTGARSGRFDLSTGPP